MGTYEANKARVSARVDYDDQPLDRRLATIVAAVPPRSQVLDVACGAGTVMQALRAKSCTVSGIDLSPGAVSSARAKGLRVLHGDVDQFESDTAIRNLLTAKYDVVIFSKCLSHLRRKNALMKVLNTKCILINQRNPSHWREALKRLVGRPTETLDTGPWLDANGTDVPQNSLAELRTWGESYGYRSKILHGSALKGRDAVTMLYR